VVGRITIGTILFLLCVLTLYPFWYVLVSSLSDPQSGSDAWLWVKDFYWANYRVVFTTGGIWRAYLMTVLRVAITVPIFLLLTGSTAFGLATKRLPGRRTLLVYFLIPMYFGGGLIPYFLLLRSLGLVNTFAVFVLPSLFGVWSLLVMLTTYRSLPDGLIEAAEIEGANPLTIFLRIVIPISLPLMASIGLFHAVALWNDWFTGIVYNNRAELYPLQTFLQVSVIKGQAAARSWDYYGSQDQWGMDPKYYRDLLAMTPKSLECAYVIIATAPIIALYPFVQKYFVKSVMIGSMKE
jgi:putative aldouronate transport system permease protein